MSVISSTVSEYAVCGFCGHEIRKTKSSKRWFHGSKIDDKGYIGCGEYLCDCSTPAPPTAEYGFNAQGKWDPHDR